MRRQALHEVGPFDQSLHYAFDWDMWMRLGGRFPARMIDRVMAASREYPSTKTASGGFLRTEEIRRLTLRHSGRELSVGYLNYLMSTVLETLPGSELPQRARLEGAVSAVLSVCHELLGQDRLRERASDKDVLRHEIGPFVDGWVPPELRLHRVLPPAGAFLGLSGVHDHGVADLAGPLTLRASVNGRLLGMSVIVMPGLYTVKLTVNGTTVSQPLTVKMDPRATITAVGLTQQFALATQIADMMNRTFDAIGSPQSPATSHQTELTNLNNDLATAYDVVEGADRAPTVQAVKAVAALRQRLVKLVPSR